MHTDTKIYWAKKLPDNLSGSIAVIIDVLAATTNIVAFLTAHVGALYLASDQTLPNLQKAYPQAITIGDGKGVDFPNDPTQLQKQEVFKHMRGKTVLYRTSNGTAAVHTALEKGAQAVITASFTNITAVNKYVTAQSLPTLLIPAGEQTVGDNWEAPEDMACALLLKTLLASQSIAWRHEKAKIKAKITNYYKRHYQNTNRPAAHLESDALLVLTIDTSTVVPLCSLKNNNLISVTAA